MFSGNYLFRKIQILTPSIFIITTSGRKKLVERKTMADLFYHSTNNKSYNH